MPAGTYRILDDARRTLGTEEFRTAPGIAGSRWFSTLRISEPSPHEEVVDLSVDADWRPVRLRIGTGEHHLVLERAGTGFSGARDEAELEMGSVTDFAYRSPAFNAATANRLMAEGRSRADLEVTRVEPFTLELGTSNQRYERLGDGEVGTRVGRFSGSRWRYTILDSGRTGDVWLAGAVVVSYPGVFELTHYDPIGVGPFPL